jgi:glycosyltransferase involved in cell wall biosynthesis
MRILQVIEFFSPVMGGSAQVAYQISRHLARRGHQVSVWSSDYRIDEAKFSQEGFQVKFYPAVSSSWGFYPTPGLIGAARRFLREFDVVHLHNVRTFQNVIVSRFAKKYDIPYVLQAHGSLPLIVRRRLTKRAFDLLFGCCLLQGAGRLVAVSEVEAQQYRERGISADRIRVIYNGLDLNEFADLPPKGSFRVRLPQLQAGAKLIAYLGRIEERKGLHLLIQAFGKLLGDCARTQLVIAGPDEGIQQSLHSLAAGLGLDGCVIFNGPLYGCDRLALLADADVVVLPAVHEIFGLVPFEALLCGTPVIVSDDSGSGQLIARAGAGWLVQYGDVPGLAAVLHQALTADEAEIQLKVRSGQEFVRNNLDWHRMIIELEEVYGEVCH